MTLYLTWYLTANTALTSNPLLCASWTLQSLMAQSRARLRLGAPELGVKALDDSRPSAALRAGPSST